VPQTFRASVNILSAWNTNDTAANTDSGTSMAAAHVTGVAARYLENHQMASPAAVWNAIHYANDISTTSKWPGVMNAGLGSPNELLHWGSLNDGYNDGEPHLTTVDGVHYDFQSVGEFVSVRDGHGLEIQTRQTPIGTTFNPGPIPTPGSRPV
jgi:subtilisin family serine protease